MRWAALLLLVCAACASDPETPATFEEACALVPDCLNPPNRLAGGRLAIWRVPVLRRADGSYSVGEVVEIEVAEAVGVPQGPLEGDVALAGIDRAGEPVEVQLLHFADSLRLSPLDLFEDHVEMPLAGDSTTVGYLRVSGDIEQIAIVEPDGTILAETNAPSPGEETRESEIRSSINAVVRPAPEGPCAHVALLDRQDMNGNLYPESLREEHPIYDPSPTQEVLIRVALGRLEPMVCAGISRIAIVRLGDNFGGSRAMGFVAAVAGDLILLNRDVMYPREFGGLSFSESSLGHQPQRARFEHTLIHEAAHTMEWLLNFEGGDQFRGRWAVTQRRLAASTIERVRLEGGLKRAWLRLQQGFVAQSWAKAYLVDPRTRGQIRGANPLGVARFGVMSYYGSKNHHEDIAEMLAYPITGRLLRSSGLPEGPPPLANDYGCRAMRDHSQANVNQSLATVYTKLSFLRDLGAVSEEDFEWCTGGVLGLEVNTEGFTVLQNNTVQRTFAENPEGMIGSRDDRYVFTMSARGSGEFDGTTYPADAYLELALSPRRDASGAEIPVEQVSWPRGLYRIDPPLNSFSVRLEGEAAGNIEITDGWVLVTEATNERIVGSVFARQALRPQAPFPVPQTFDPPLNFRFLLRN